MMNYDRTSAMRLLCCGRPLSDLEPVNMFILARTGGHERAVSIKDPIRYSNRASASKGNLISFEGARAGGGGSQRGGRPWRTPISTCRHTVRRPGGGSDHSLEAVRRGREFWAEPNTKWDHPTVEDSNLT